MSLLLSEMMLHFMFSETEKDEILKRRKKSEALSDSKNNFIADVL